MPTTLDDIMVELKAIRTLVEAQTATTTAAPPAPAQGYPKPPTGGRFDDEPVPQPNPAWPLADAEAHHVHFGKNAGVPLRDLKDTSLAFYAKEKPPQMKRDGKTPFEKRKPDLDLENAARTVWHTRRGTLAGGPRDTPATPPTPQQKPASAPPAQEVDEDVPF